MAHEHHHEHHEHHEHDCEHEHACGCCGHDHDHEGDESRLKLPLLIAAAVLFIAAFVLHFFDGFDTLCMILSIAAVIASGYDVILDGVKNAVKLRLDETTLMTVAVIAAMALGEFVEAAAVTVLFGIGEYLEDKAVEKSRRDIRRLADIRPDTAVIFENGAAHEAAAESVAVGTILQIAPHARVPLDGVVTEGYGTVDASSLTGESEPVNIEPGSELMSGMLNGDSAILMQTTKAYADSAATRIVKLVEDSAKNKGNSEKLITRFARVYTPAVVLLGVLIAVIPSLITGDWATWIHRALVCLVASCPCSIVISVPLAYFAGIGAASKIGLLIKGGRYVEALAAAGCVAFDKTGTLTENHISVKEIKSLGNHSVKEITVLAASVEAHSAHPIAAAIRSYAEEHHISVRELSDYTEIPARGVGALDGNRIITCGKDQDIDGIVVSVDHEPIGVITLREAIRPEAANALRELRRLGVEGLYLLSGDKDATCRYTADQVGITAYYSGLLPEDKVEKVAHLSHEYGSCVFVGDGINDAPVLSRADCGIAMGLGSDAAIESADMVLSSENLTTLPRAVRLCRSTMKTVKANIALSLSVKALVITLAAVGIAPLWLAVLADTGVCLVCVLNAVRLIKKRV
jgi:Cd2+/Zn2+-exporting ATPase